MEQPELLSERLLSVVDRGFRAVKMGWGPFGRVSDKLDEAIVCTAREAVGPDIDLMVDAGGSDAFWSQGLKWASRTAHMLAEYDVRWFEEPLRPDNLQDFAALRRQAMVPIAGGEVLTRRQSFRSWLQSGAFDIVQPDVTKVGGISESRRIAWMAEANGVRYIPHGWNTAVGLAADLHLASAIMDTDLVEYIDGSPYVDELSADGWKLDEAGMLPVPDSPGLGLRLDVHAVERYTGETLGGWTGA
jgi:L-alanine-DL-glutamate epimerase-like enolase superfamily enzyme